MRFFIVAGLILIGFIIGLGIGIAPLTNANTFNQVLEPTVRVPQDKIQLSDSSARIHVPELRWATIADTGSMKPTLTKNTHVLQIEPTSTDELAEGDIISFAYKNKIIIHRIIKIGTDETGWYAITKGDNNPVSDPEKVRFNQIDRVVVGIIY